MRSLSFDTAALARLFAVRNFALYTSGSAVSQIGLWVQRLAIGWLVWDLTHSGIWLGAVAIAEFLPTMAVTPFAGVLSDRADRRKVTMIAQSMSAVLAVILWLLTIAGWVAAWHVVAIQFLAGALSSIAQSSRIALIPTLVPRDLLGQALAINSISFNLARFVGPAVAGALIATAGIGWTFFVNAASYVPVVWALNRLELPKRQIRQTAGYLQEMLEGFTYSINHHAIATLIVLMSLAALFTRATIELLPGFADEVFGRGAGGLSILVSAGGIGAVIAGLILAQRTNHRGMTTLVIGAVMANAAAIIVFAATDNFTLGVIMMAVSGACQVTSGTSSQTLVQVAVPDAMRGRVMSNWLMINRGGPALGAMIFGWLSEHYGWGWPTVIGSCVTILACAWALRRRAALAQQLETNAHLRDVETREEP